MALDYIWLPLTFMHVRPPRVMLALYKCTNPAGGFRFGCPGDLGVLEVMHDPPYTER